MRDTPRARASEESSLDRVIAAYAEGVDATLIQRNLRLSHEERFLQLMDLQRLASELARAGREARGE